MTAKSVKERRAEAKKVSKAKRKAKILALRAYNDRIRAKAKELDYAP
tara:strand:+ start:928 stop:1068 length:141 start_codon:yes stop_codon:yes gene_type:complete